MIEEFENAIIKTGIKDMMNGLVSHSWKVDNEYSTEVAAKECLKVHNTEVIKVLERIKKDLTHKYDKKPVVGQDDLWARLDAQISTLKDETGLLNN